jgi:hypothetical protein
MVGPKSLLGMAPWALGAICAAGVVLPQPALASPHAPAVTFTRLTLQHGWFGSPFTTRKPAVANISGIVTFKGAMATNGNNAFPFTLPRAFRPSTNVYVPVDLCDTNYGRLFIRPSGVVEVQSEGSFTNATCFTSLEGVSFAKSAKSFTALKLRNGWLNAPFGTSKAKARVISGIVHLKGAIWTRGNNAEPFVLPSGFRPGVWVYATADMCGATKGRLNISPKGVVSVEAEQDFGDAKCFTSLDGVTFAVSGRSFTGLSLFKGWHPYGFSTAKPSVRVISGTVRFRGAIATNGSSGDAFVLPAGMRPATNVYVSVDLCDANYGRLFISPSGVVDVEAEGGTFSHAQCFTSLDGAWFVR